MRIGYGLGYGGGVSPLHLALGTVPGAQLHADYQANLYYAAPDAFAAASGVTDSLPVGEPTSAGLALYAAATNSVRSPTDLDGIGWSQAFNCTTSDDTVSHDELTLQGISTDGGQNYPQIRGGGASDAITIGDGEKCSVTYYVVEGSSPSFYVGLTPTTAIQTSGAVFDWTSGQPVHSGDFSIHVGTDVDSHEVKSLGGGLYRVRSTIQNNSGGSLSYYPFIYPIDVSTGDGAVYDNALYIGGINVVAGDAFSPLITSASTRAAAEPTLVQGAGPVPYPGYSGTEHTVSVSWDADGTTGDRVVWEGRKDADNRMALHFVSGILRFESFVSGISEGFVAVPDVDDGGAHSAVIYWDEVSGTLTLQVDGQPVTSELIDNGDFASDDLTGWSFTDCTGAVVGGQFVVTTTIASGFVRAVYSGGNIGLDYKGSLQVVSADTLANRVLTNLGGNFVSNGVAPYDITDYSFAAVNTEAVYLQMAVDALGQNFVVDNLTVTSSSAKSGLTLPTNLTEFHLGHSDGVNQLNGLMKKISAANGDHLAAWT